VEVAETPMTGVMSVETEDTSHTNAQGVVVVVVAADVPSATVTVAAEAGAGTAGGRHAAHPGTGLVLPYVQIRRDPVPSRPDTEQQRHRHADEDEPCQRDNTSINTLHIEILA